MERQIVEHRGGKGLFKSAVAVGAGLAVGQFIGKNINGLLLNGMLKLTDELKKKSETDETTE